MIENENDESNKKTSQIRKMSGETQEISTIGATRFRTDLKRGLTDEQVNALTDYYAKNLDPSESFASAAIMGTAFGTIMANPRTLVHPWNSLTSFGDVKEMFKGVKENGSAMNKLWKENNVVMEEAYSQMQRAKARSKWKIGAFRKRYTKDEILEMYLNHIYFGQGAYGVESAARYYFNKEAKDLNIAESATLAAIPKSPNYFNPFENPKASKERQELVIDQMVKYGFITEAQGEAAKKEELKLATTAKKREDNPNFYFIDMITQKVIDELGAEALYKGGLKVYTTLDSDMQRAAIESLKHLPAPVMEEKDLGKLKEDEHPVAYNDKNKLTQPQVALVAIDPNTGHVKAMLGGRGQDKFNRATLSVRQPGSSFKPFVYLTGMANGFTPASIMEDKEEEFEKDWKPKNVTKKLEKGEK